MSRTALMFSYGTLRPGCALTWMLRGAVVATHEAVLADHALYWAGSRIGPGGFPVMVPEPGQSAVGTLYAVRLGRQLDSVVRMELGAGYDLANVTVDVEGFDEPLRASAFLWPWPQKGPRVAHNDWLRRFDTPRT